VLLREIWYRTRTRRSQFSLCDCARGRLTPRPSPPSPRTRRRVSCEARSCGLISDDVSVGEGIGAPSLREPNEVEFPEFRFTLQARVPREPGGVPADNSPEQRWTAPSCPSDRSINRGHPTKHRELSQWQLRHAGEPPACRPETRDVKEREHTASKTTHRNRRLSQNNVIGPRRFRVVLLIWAL